MEILSTNNLSKIYSDGTQALKDINISCKEGQLHCLVGPNGAGKTTLLRILSTQLLPTHGNAYIMGFDILREAEKVRKRIAVVPQDAGPDVTMTPWQHVYWYLISRGESLVQAKKAAESTLKLLGLWEIRDRYAIALSGGQRKRILVAMALATDADILFLDEPTAGLDPLARRSVWSALRERVKNGQTVFLTTHNMEEAEALADDLYMINKGEIVVSGTTSEFKSCLSYKFKVTLKLTTDADEFKKYGDLLIVGDRITVYPRSDKELQRLIATCTTRGMRLEIRSVDLEDVFIKLIGEKP